MQTSLVNLFPFVPLNCLEDCEVPSSTEVPSPHRLKASTACAACLLVRVSRSRAALPGVATLRSDWPRGWLKSCLLIGRLKFWRKNLFSFLLTQTLSLSLSFLSVQHYNPLCDSNNTNNNNNMNNDDDFNKLPSPSSLPSSDIRSCDLFSQASPRLTKWACLQQRCCCCCSCRCHVLGRKNLKAKTGQLVIEQLTKIIAQILSHQTDDDDYPHLAL